MSTGVLERNDETNKHLGEIFSNIKILAEGTLCYFEEKEKGWKDKN